MTRHVRQALTQRLAVLREQDDRGFSLIATMAVVAVLLGMSASAGLLATKNMSLVGASRQGTQAVNAADAGVAAGVQYLRQYSYNSITCPTASVATTWSTTTAAGCLNSTNRWSNATNPAEVSSGGRKYRVFISYLSKPTAAARAGTFRIHSAGSFNDASRLVTQDVDLRPFQYPIGIYADSIVDAGTPQVYGTSIYSAGCITGRDHLKFTGNDVFYGGPSAAHSVDGITLGNGCTTTNSIHASTKCNLDTGPRGNPYSLKYDQDKYGDALTASSPCYVSPQHTTSAFTTNDLKAVGWRTRGLSATEYQALARTARAQNQYYTSTSFTAPDPSTYPNAVMYFKLSGGTVSIQDELNAYGEASCGTRSLVIVVEGGDVHINAQADITGSLFIPDGNLSGNGGAKLTGTAFSKTLDKFNGNATFQNKQCFLDNPPASLQQLTLKDYRVDDRTQG